MRDETHYKVITEVELTVRADTSEAAAEIALLAIGDVVVGGNVRTVMTDRDKTSANKIEFDADEMTKMERWLEAPLTHPFTD